MRRIMLLLFTVLPLFVVAQKKVAVMETTRMTNEVTMMQSQMVRGGLETAVANAPGYEGYDRTSFDAIMREQNFQRSGAVSDAQIKKLGEMAGVQYIIVSDASSEGGYFYVLVKMLDVETGKYGAAYDQLCTTSAVEIKKACTELGAKLFGVPNETYTSSNSSSGTLKEQGKDKNEKSSAVALENARTYFKSGESAKAEQYYNEAILLEENNLKKADMYYELGLLYFTGMNNYVKARQAARNALSAAPNFGKAYMLLGKVYAAGGKDCGESTFEKKCLYWLVVDQFQKAKNVDPSLASEANQLIARYSEQFPTKVDAFWEDVKDGQTITIGCWINETTTARFIK